MLPRTPISLKAELRREDLNRLSEVANPHRLEQTVIVLGPGGIGKSTLLHCFESANLTRVKARLDLGASRNRSALGVASSLLRNLDEHATRAFFEVAAEARLAGTERLTRNALTLCEQLVAALAVSGDLVILDNVDRASLRVRSWLFTGVLPRSPMQAICAARTLPNDLAGAATIDILPFGGDRLEQLSRSWAPYVGVSEGRLLDSLLRYSDGHPVQAELAAWALSSVKDAEPDIATTSNLKSLLSVAWRSLPVRDQGALAAAICARQRIDTTILDHLEPGARLEAVSELPFAVPIDDAVGGWVVHPVALDRLQDAVGIEPSKIERGRRTLTDLVYPRLISAGQGEEASAVLGLERLRYLASLPTSDDFAAIDRAFRARLQRSELWRADEIAQIALEVLDSPRQSLKLSAALVVIENSIAHHDIADAQSQLGGIARSQLATASALVRARVQYLRAKCVTSPAALSGQEIFSVSGTLDVALKDALASGGSLDLAQDIRFELGHACRLVARYEDALDCFAEIERAATEMTVRIRAVEEQAQLYRHMQDLDSAEAAQGRAALLRLEGDLEISGHGLYCLATLRRDRNEFASAERLYLRALDVALGENDDYLACNIKGDMAWMKFLDGEMKASRELLGEYERLAELYGFSRELSECWHMRYHHEADVGNWSRGYEHLETALTLAKDFGNVVMQLDCMMHFVQRAVREGRVDETETIIHDMELIEARGCGIRVFRGRARIYQGDGFYSAKREREAALVWRDGFEIVANFGNSRSNVELLGALIGERRERFLAALQRFSGLAPNWPMTCDGVVRERIERALVE